MNPQNFIVLPVLSAAFFLLSGCVARESVSPAASAPGAVPAALSFNEQVAALPEGATQYFAESPFGPAADEAGPFYLSGLGNECRPVRVTRDAIRHRFALCRNENGEWDFIPAIFESMPR